MTNLSLLRSTSCRVGASVLDAAEDLEDGEDVHTGPSLRPQSRTFRLTTHPWVDDVVVESNNWASSEAAGGHISIDSLLALNRFTESKAGPLPHRFDLDLATSSKINPRQKR